MLAKGCRGQEALASCLCITSKAAEAGFDDVRFEKNLMMARQPHRIRHHEVRVLQACIRLADVPVRPSSEKDLISPRSQCAKWLI